MGEENKSNPENQAENVPQNNQWEGVFKEKGEVFTEAQEDMPRIVQLLKKEGVKDVLDLGCGAGRHSVFLADQGFNVSGIDGSPSGIEITKKRLEEKGLSGDFRVGDIYDEKGLPFPAESFDAIVSTQVIHHNTIEEIRALIKEMKKVLRPNGTAFVTVIKGDLRYAGPVDEIAPNTYAPKEGREKGLPHYYFNAKTLRNEFESENFEIGKDEIWEESQEPDNPKKPIHICLLGKKK